MMSMKKQPLKNEAHSLRQNVFVSLLEDLLETGKSSCLTGGRFPAASGKALQRCLMSIVFPVEKPEA